MKDRIAKMATNKMDDIAINDPKLYNKRADFPIYKKL